MAEEKKENKKASPEEEEKKDKKKEEKEESPDKEKDKEEEEKESKEKKEEKKEEPEKKESKEEAEEEVEVPEKFEEIVNKISEMSVLDLSELVKVLEKKFGVSAQAPVAAAPSAAPEKEEKSEKAEYDIELKEVGDKKIEVIKAVRDITEKGLKEAKGLVDEAPQVIKEKVKKEEAQEMKKKLEQAGATVELK